MSTPSEPEYPIGSHSEGGATRRVSVFGRNSRDGSQDPVTAEAEWQDSQPTRAVGPEEEFGDDTPTAALPTSYVPADVGPAPTAALPVSANGGRRAASSSRPEPLPESGYGQPVAPPMPVRLPSSPVRRRTAATPLGTVMVLLASALLGWGMYTVLISLNVFNLIRGEHSLINTTAAAAFGIGGVLAFIAFIVAIVAVARARPKKAAVLLLLASLVLPTAATVGGAYYGAIALKDQTIAQAYAYADAVDVEQIDAAINRVESLGVNVPGKDRVLDILRAAKGEG
ncbi:hypothetical protein [Actinomyces qiguomingii]|uniref:hypothetical protein n=1 Tax=Actinomyces qiguomingii TaxID=2057800 RepID=UPI000FFE7630|nr:hypothetical protein [Actinomyces qiguomingii]